MKDTKDLTGPKNHHIDVVGLSYLSDHDLDSNNIVGCAGSDILPMSVTGNAPNC